MADDGDRVTLTKMRRDEWIIYNWINVTAYKDPEPVYLKAGYRLIEDRKVAADNFDAVFVHGGEK